MDFPPAVMIIFFISLVLYVGSSYYKTEYAKALFDNRENDRNFAINLSKVLHNKAGLIVANNNFDPIMPATFLRIMLRMPDDEIASYQYDKNLIISTTGKNRIIDIRDIVKYAHVSKNNNQYTIYLD